MKSDLYTSEQVMVINSANGVEMAERYVADVVEETVTEVAYANNQEIS